MRRVQNFTPETYAAKAQSAGQKRKRSRQLSCRFCKRTKIGCDRKRPSCGNCLRKGISGECSYEDLDGDDDHINANQFTYAHPPNVSDQHSKTPVLVTMEGRLGKMERTIENLASNVNSTRSPEASSLSATPPCPRWSAITAHEAQQKHENQMNPHSGGVLCSKTSGPLYYIGKTGWTVVQDDDVSLFMLVPGNILTSEIEANTLQWPHDIRRAMECIPRGQQRVQGMADSQDASLRFNYTGSH